MMFLCEQERKNREIRSMNFLQMTSRFSYIS